MIRYGIAVPSLVISLGVTYTRWFPPHWREWMSFILLFNAGLWSTHRVFVPAAPAEWAYAGLMVILMFCYILSRLPFAYSSIVGVLMIAYYNVVSYGIVNDTVRELWLADSFLVSIAVIGMAAGYGLERNERLVFLRERQLDRARRRADELLRNTLPGSIVDRLQAGDTAPQDAQIADGLEHVTVLFADLVQVHGARVAHRPARAGGGARRRVHAVRRGGRPRRDGEDQDGRRRVHGGRRCAGPAARSRRRGRPDGAGHHGTASTDARWPTGEPMRHPGRRGVGPGGRGCDRPEEVRVRPVGRHGERGEQAGVARRAGADPRLGGHARTARGPVHVQRAHHGGAEGQRSDARRGSCSVGVEQGGPAPGCSPVGAIPATRVRGRLRAGGSNARRSG